MITAMPKTKTLTIRMPEDLVALIENAAETETRSVNGQIVQLVREAFACREQRKQVA